MNTKLLTAGALAALLVGAPGAQAAGAGAPTFRTEHQYAHCAGDSKIQNIPAVQGQSAPLTTTAPTGSLLDGGGCGTVAVPSPVGTPGDLTWTGSFMGNIRSVTVDLYDVFVGGGRAFGTVYLDVTLTVDGNVVFARTVYPGVTALAPINQPGQDVLLFTISGLDKKLALEEGDGSAVRSIGLHVRAYWNTETRCGCAENRLRENGGHTFLSGAREVPSGITLNNSAAAGPTIAAS